MMDLNDLVVFERVVSTGSFTAAAAAMSLGKSTVSERISRLEGTLGVRLLQRTTRSLRLTEDGAAFYARCQRILADVQDAEAALTQAGEVPRGTLRLTCPRLFAYAFLGPVITAFTTAWPEVSVDLVLAERSVDLVEEGFDLALRIGQLPDSSLVVRRLGAAPMVFVASPAYLETAGPVLPSTLADHQLLGVGRDGPIQWPLCLDGQIRPVPIDARIRVNSLVVARDLAMAGAGVAFLPTFLCAEPLARELLVPVLSAHLPPPMAVNALYPSSRHLSPRVRVFLDLLVEQTRVNPPWEIG